MILHRLTIEDFRGVERETVEIPQRGVLVVEGPNESGKTSLMDALEMLLEHKASSGRAEIKAASPVGRDVPVVVEAEFTVDGERMRYRKEFVRGKRTSLEFPESARVALSGDDAHDHVRDLLDRKVDRSLWRALRIAQDEPIGQVDAAKGMDSLRRALDSAAGGSDPTGDDALITRVAEERNRYLTARRGEPTGELARSEARVAEARTALAAAETRHAELDAAVAEHAAHEATHRSRQDSLSVVRAEVDRLEEAGRAVSEVREACRSAEAEVDRAVAAHDTASRAHRERLDLVARTEREQARQAGLHAAAEQAQQRLEPAEDRARRARLELDEAEERVTRARAVLEAERAARDRERQLADLRSIESLLDTLRSVGEELVEREAELARVTLSEGAVGRIREAEEASREAAVRSAASAPRVEVSGTGQFRIGADTFDAGPGWAREIVEDTVFRVGDVALTVVPAGDTDAVRRDEADARSRLAALLAEAGVSSLAEAEEREKHAGDLRGEISALRRRRADLLGDDTLDDLARRRDALAAEVAPESTGSTGSAATDDEAAGPEAGTDREAGEDLEAGTDQVVGSDWGVGSNQGAETDPEVGTADAELELTRRRAEDRAATAEAQSLRTEFATRSALAEEAAGRVSECTEALAEARRVTGDSELAEAEKRARDRVDAARETARLERSRLEEALAEAPPELLANARASLTALVAEERRSAEAVATALGLVNAIADQGRLDDVSAAERELESAERENAALWRRARAADLLHRTLTARRSEALLAYQKPFHRAVVELGSLVYGRDFDVQLGEDLTILSRRTGDVTVPYESLSGGAREQLAVIVRIACARLVGDSGVPVFLDDTMGYTDPSRRLLMGAVIAAAASTSQVIVLTCDRARFAGIGGAGTHVMRGAVTARV